MLSTFISFTSPHQLRLSSLPKLHKITIHVSFLGRFHCYSYLHIQILLHDGHLKFGNNLRRVYLDLAVLILSPSSHYSEVVGNEIYVKDLIWSNV
jgi:hypothetical protein